MGRLDMRSLAAFRAAANILADVLMGGLMKEMIF
jgi:hypothetical protein